MPVEKKILDRVPVLDNIAMFLSRGQHGISWVRVYNRVPHDYSKPDILKDYLPDIREGDTDIFVSIWPEIVPRQNKEK